MHVASMMTITTKSSTDEQLVYVIISKLLYLLGSSTMARPYSTRLQSDVLRVRYYIAFENRK